MKTPGILIIVIGVMSLAGIILWIRLNRIESPKTTNPTEQTNTIQNQPCVPTFADGGGPYYQANSPFRDKIAPEQNNGEQLTVKGKILQNDCKTPVANAVLDIWQANESGNYEDEWYRGQVRTDQDGNYEFQTVVPKGYGEGSGFRPPHIHFKVHVNNQEVITSQMFFPESKGKPGFEDAYIMKLETKTQNGKNIHTGTHNIILS